MVSVYINKVEILIGKLLNDIEGIPPTNLHIRLVSYQCLKRLILLIEAVLIKPDIVSGLNPIVYPTIHSHCKFGSMINHPYEVSTFAHTQLTNMLTVVLTHERIPKAVAALN